MVLAKEELQATIDSIIERDGRYDDKAVFCVNTIIEMALKFNASDIHFNPTPHNFTEIVIRVNGKLIKIATVPMMIYSYMSAYIKGKSGIPKQEKRNLDGSMEYLYSNEKYAQIPVSFRVAVSWAAKTNNSKITMRVMPIGINFTNLIDLGFEKKDYTQFKSSLDAAKGIIMVSGPTGSGKSTTLYSALKEIKEERHILTIEDPIETGVDGITQLQVTPDIGFLDHLKAALRHDPDVIMIGEIRDAETAQTAVSAALSGHLVLSTIHANSAIVTIARLADLGADVFNLSYSLRATTAQRLIPKLCSQCRFPIDTPEVIKVGLKKYFGENFVLPQQVFTSEGCEYCRQSGIESRKMVYESIFFDREDQNFIFDLLKSRQPLEKTLYQHLVKKYKYKNVFEKAYKYAVEGMFRMEDVLRYCF